MAKDVEAGLKEATEAAGAWRDSYTRVREERDAAEQAALEARAALDVERRAHAAELAAVRRRAEAWERMACSAWLLIEVLRAAGEGRAS